MAHEADSLAVLFPGQGVGDAAARDLVREQRPDLLALAGKLVGDDPFARIGDGTRFAQPAVYCAALAGFERLGRPAGDAATRAIRSARSSALAAAGAVDELDGLRIVVARGRLMDAAAAQRRGPAACSPSAATASEALALAERSGLELANENSPSPVRAQRPRRRGSSALEAEARERWACGPSGSPSPAPFTRPRWRRRSSRFAQHLGRDRVPLARARR